MSGVAFEPKGAVSLTDACAALIQETPEREGFAYPIAVTEIRARTGIDDLRKADIMGPMLTASKRLRAAGIPGVKNLRRTGWQRETAQDLIADAVHRERKTRRQAVWMADSAAAADPEQLAWPDRERRTELQRKARVVAELEQRRSRRLRPVPPPEGIAG